MPIRLDERLSAIASKIRCGTVADIGCDHGKLGLYLLQTDRAKKVIATDISPQSLAKTTAVALENGVSAIMETRLGDGLSPVLNGEADVVVIAGLGGDVIAEILQKSVAEGKIFSSFLLSPNTHSEKVRRALSSLGHIIVDDSLTECGGKYYTIILSHFSAGEQIPSLTEKQLLFGAFYRADAVFKKRAAEELSAMKNILAAHYSEELDGKLALLKSAYDEVEV